MELFLRVIDTITVDVDISRSRSRSSEPFWKRYENQTTPCTRNVGLNLYARLPVFYCLLCCYSYVEGLAELVVRSGSDIARLQDQGNKIRRMSATDMNEHSSRYCIGFMVYHRWCKRGAMAPLKS